MMNENWMFMDELHHDDVGNGDGNVIHDIGGGH
jgi:hypothetical protein